MNRRQALRVFGGIAAGAAGAYAWHERRGLTRDDLDGDASGQETLPSALTPALGAILSYASLAPSGHNAQPWVVQVGDGELRIGTERLRWLPAVDPLNRELALSVGAFLENLLVAAPAHGYAAEYDVTGVDARDDELLRVMLRSAPSRPAPLEMVRARRTLRSGYLAQELSQADVQNLIAPFPNEGHFFTPTSREGRYLAEGLIEANRVQAARDDAQNELSDWIRWTNAEASRRRDGLTTESMEISGVAGWYVRHFMKRATVLTRQFRDQGVDRVRNQVAACGGWLVITSRDVALPTLIETGRRAERMWLGVRDRSIAIHPMTQMLEEAPFRDRVAQELGVTGEIQFILRVGYVKRYPNPVSLRRPVSSIVRV